MKTQTTDIGNRESRDFCKELEGGAFPKFNLKKATRLRLLEKMALKFIKKQYFVDEIEGTTLVYKMWRGKMYVLKHFVNSPKGYNCRHKITNYDFIGDGKA